MAKINQRQDYDYSGQKSDMKKSQKFSQDEDNEIEESVQVEKKGTEIRKRR